MKKIITSLTFTSLLFLAIGCSSDDSSTPPPPPPPPEPTTQELLIGKWNIQEEGEIINGIKKAYEMDDCSAKDTYDFTKDFQYINEYHEKQQNQDCTTHNEQGTWLLKNEKSLLLTFSSQEIPTITETADVKIVLITATELQLEYKEEEDNNTYYLHLKK